MKTPFWLSGIKVSVMLAFIAYFFVEGDRDFFNLPNYLVLFIVAFVIFLGSICIGIFRTISRAQKTPVKYLNE